MGISKREQIRDLEQQNKHLLGRLDSARRHETYLTRDRNDAVEVIVWLAKKAGVYDVYSKAFEEQGESYEEFSGHVLASEIHKDLEKAKKHNETLEALERTSKARATGGKK